LACERGRKVSWVPRDPGDEKRGEYPRQCDTTGRGKGERNGNGFRIDGKSN